MKVQELIALLGEFDPEKEVVVARDEEGNGFLSLQIAEEAGAYREGWNWEVLHPDDVADYKDEDNFEEVVVLWP